MKDRANRMDKTVSQEENGRMEFGRECWGKDLDICALCFLISEAGRKEYRPLHLWTFVRFVINISKLTCCSLSLFLSQCQHQRSSMYMFAAPGRRVSRWWSRELWCYWASEHYTIFFFFTELLHNSSTMSTAHAQSFFCQKRISCKFGFFLFLDIDKLGNKLLS